MERLEVAMERDPFHYFSGQATAPSATPVQVPQVPTQAPSARYDFIVGNGGCSVGTHLFEIRMTDTWGDGWDKTSLKIYQLPLSDAGFKDEGTTITNDADGDTVTMSKSEQMYQVPSKTAEVEIFHGSLENGATGYSYAVSYADRRYVCRLFLCRTSLMLLLQNSALM